MSKQNKTTAKKVTAPVVGAVASDAKNATIQVIRAHDGLLEGETYLKPFKVAKMMEKQGYWKIIA